MVTAQELADDFRRLNGYLAGDGDAGASPQRLVDLACVVVPGCRWAAITFWPVEQRPRTIAQSADVPQQVDLIQYTAGEGPCLSAAAQEGMVWSPDLAREDRWPGFVRRARSSTPVAGVLSFHLPTPAGRHALNLYADSPGALDQDAVATGTLSASHAGVLLEHEAAARQSAGLRSALTTSRQIGAAVGMLMGTYQLSEPAAMDVLRRVSSQLNEKLRDVAAQVTATGRLPGDGSNRKP